MVQTKVPGSTAALDKAPSKKLKKEAPKSKKKVTAPKKKPTNTEKAQPTEAPQIAQPHTKDAAPKSAPEKMDETTQGMHQSLGLWREDMKVLEGMPSQSLRMKGTSLDMQIYHSMIERDLMKFREISKKNQERKENWKLWKLCMVKKSGPKKKSEKKQTTSSQENGLVPVLKLNKSRIKHKKSAAKQWSKRAKKTKQGQLSMPEVNINGKPSLSPREQQPSCSLPDGMRFGRSSDDSDPLVPRAIPIPPPPQAQSKSKPPKERRICSKLSDSSSDNDSEYSSLVPRMDNKLQNPPPQLHKPMNASVAHEPHARRLLYSSDDEPEGIDVVGHHHPDVVPIPQLKIQQESNLLKESHPRLSDSSSDDCDADMAEPQEQKVAPLPLLQHQATKLSQEPVRRSPKSSFDLPALEIALPRPSDMNQHPTAKPPQESNLLKESHSRLSDASSDESDADMGAPQQQKTVHLPLFQPQATKLSQEPVRRSPKSSFDLPVLEMALPRPSDMNQHPKAKPPQASSRISSSESSSSSSSSSSSDDSASSSGDELN